jgi:aryl-alcohol dehydrogenase-like predicted oxidoreductase
MRKRQFGRLGWQVGEIGYGMWGLAGWSGTDEAELDRALERAVELGVNFFDTALAYGEGRSEAVLGALVRKHPDTKLFVASKIPPRNMKWPSRRDYPLDDCFPPDHIRASVDQSLQNLGLGSLDLIQFHVWEDSWALDRRWQEVVTELLDDGLVRAVGVSINRWEPWNVLDTLRTGLIDAVQVIYNVFDQAPEDELFAACAEGGVAVIARVPFDEGSLTGTLTRDSRWPEGDWRNSYFVPENLAETIGRVDRLRAFAPPGVTMPELALRFILSNPAVATVIPGMRKVAHVESNVAASDRGALPAEVLAGLRQHRWDRTPTGWSQ